MTTLRRWGSMDRTEQDRVGENLGAGSSLEDATIAEVAMLLRRAAALSGEAPQDLVARLSDAELACVYVSCAGMTCPMRRHDGADRRCEPLPDGPELDVIGARRLSRRAARAAGAPGRC